MSVIELTYPQQLSLCWLAAATKFYVDRDDSHATHAAGLQL